MACRGLGRGYRRKGGILPWRGVGNGDPYKNPCQLSPCSELTLEKCNADQNWQIHMYALKKHTTMTKICLFSADSLKIWCIATPVSPSALNLQLAVFVSKSINWNLIFCYLRQYSCRCLFSDENVNLRFCFGNGRFWGRRLKTARLRLAVVSGSSNHKETLQIPFAYFQPVLHSVFRNYSNQCFTKNKHIGLFCIKH